VAAKRKRTRRPTYEPEIATGLAAFALVAALLGLMRRDSIIDEEEHTRLIEIAIDALFMGRQNLGRRHGAARIFDLAVDILDPLHDAATEVPPPANEP
jgi:hypothetical protein